LSLYTLSLDELEQQDGNSLEAATAPQPSSVASVHGQYNAAECSTAALPADRELSEWLTKRQSETKLDLQRALHVLDGEVPSVALFAPNAEC